MQTLTRLSKPLAMGRIEVAALLEQTRLDRLFSKTRREGRAALIGYVMGGDPSLDATLEAMHDLVKGGVDIIELGFPFTDPMADGPIIQRAGLRALDNNVSLADIFELVRLFRASNVETPIILMGYCNPIYRMGYAAFAKELAESGGEGAIIVDIPLEENAPVEVAFSAHGLALIRLVTPTTRPERLAVMAQGAQGFIYFVSVAGVTGDKSVNIEGVKSAIAHLRTVSDVPVCIGFGVRTPEDARRAARLADGVVVGSAIVQFSERLAEVSVDTMIAAIRAERLKYVQSLANGLKVA